MSERGPEEIELSVVLPCLNEAETLESSIRKVQRTMTEAGIAGEVVVADNGSSDDSIEIAQRNGARVIHVTARGYGNALMGGIAAAKGRYVLMGDPDGSYDFGHIPRFVTELRKGAELVMGNRFRGGIQPGAMPALHQYLGNPVLSGLGRLFFHSPFGDFHCGLRAFSKAAYNCLRLQTAGMEFASEMVVKATLMKLAMVEVPTTLSPDGRSRPPHLRTWRDGWRHLRFLLLYIHTMLYGAAFVLLGFQSVAFATFTKIFAIAEGLFPPDPVLEKVFRYVGLETGLLIGSALIACGLGGSLYAVHFWRSQHFGMLDYSRTMRLVIPSILLLVLGLQTVFASFFLSVLGMRRR
ncbi:MAG: dolichol-P-glucose synthetase [Acidobacteria bacterium]|nr:MAG: dolichol-P-glucose synthetase [Acidobacteriota bacterium]